MPTPIVLIETAWNAFQVEDANFSAHKPNDPNPFSVCTNCCRWIIDNYLPAAKIMGYDCDVNGSAAIGALTGGHDFIVWDDYIVDFWFKSTIEPNARYFYHLSNDAEEIRLLYGEPDLWEEVLH